MDGWIYGWMDGCNMVASNFKNSLLKCILILAHNAIKKNLTFYFMQPVLTPKTSKSQLSSILQDTEVGLHQLCAYFWFPDSLTVIQCNQRVF